MYEEYTVYKQWHSKEGRYFALLYNPLTKERRTMSWARYVMSCHLNRELDPNTETVDHDDDNKTNDCLENLKLLTRSANSRKASKGITMVKLVCPYCKREFVRPRNKTHLVKGGNPTHCSRSCAGYK